MSKKTTITFPSDGPDRAASPDRVASPDRAGRTNHPKRPGSTVAGRLAVAALVAALALPCAGCGCSITIINGDGGSAGGFAGESAGGSEGESFGVWSDNGVSKVTMDPYAAADRYAAADTFEYAAADVDSVVIHWITGKVTLVQAQDDVQKLTVEESGKGLPQDEQMHWLLEGRTLHVQFWAAGHEGKVSEADKRLFVELPKGVDLEVSVVSANIAMGTHELGEVSLDSTSGDIQADAVDAAKVDAASISGDVDLGVVGSGKSVAVETTSGDVRIASVTAKDSFDVSTISGKVDLGTVGAQGATLVTSSGDVRVGSLTAAEAVSLASITGDIAVGTAKAPKVDVDTTSGEVSLGLAECKDAQVETLSGDIELKLEGGLGATVSHASMTGGYMVRGSHTDADASTTVVGDGACQVSLNSASGEQTVVIEG